MFVCFFIAGEDMAEVLKQLALLKRAILDQLFAIGFVITFTKACVIVYVGLKDKGPCPTG